MWTESGHVAHRFHDVVCFKGGGSAPPPKPTPQAFTDPVTGMTYSDTLDPQGNVSHSGAGDLNAEVQQRMANEKAVSDAAAAKKAQDDATAESTFQTSRQNAYNDALNAVTRNFQLQGVDPNQYMQSDIIPTLQRQFNSIQDLDPNPSAAFPTSLGDTIASDITSGRRTQATNQINSLFPSTYVNSALPDTVQDPYVSQILGEQFDPLNAQLTNAQKRGTLTGSGYQAALDALNQRKSAATSTIRSLGSGILNTDRSSLNDLISGAKTDASGLSLSGAFDPSSYQNLVQGKTQSELGDFGGALRSAVGDTKFADITDLLNAGGAVQGANNPIAANANIAGAGAAPVDPNLINQKRGLGSVGAF